MALHVRRSVVGPRKPLGMSHPSHLAIHALQEGGEDLDWRVRIIVPGSELCASGRYLHPLRVGTEHHGGDSEAAPPPDRLGDSLQGGAQLVAICIHCGPDGILSGACVHGPCTVHGIGRIFCLPLDMKAPPLKLPRILHSFYIYNYPPWA